MTETRMERNRRARAYSHACRIRRLRNALWAVAAVLTVLLAVELIWLLSSRPAPAPPRASASKHDFVAFNKITACGRDISLGPGGKGAYSHRTRKNRKGEHHERIDGTGLCGGLRRGAAR